MTPEPRNEAAERLRTDIREAFDGPALAEVLADLDAALAAERAAPKVDVERLAIILGAAEGDGIIGPDYTPEALAEYILARLAGEER